MRTSFFLLSTVMMGLGVCNSAHAEENKIQSAPVISGNSGTRTKIIYNLDTGVALPGEKPAQTYFHPAHNVNLPALQPGAGEAGDKEEHAESEAVQQTESFTFGSAEEEPVANMSAQTTTQESKSSEQLEFSGKIEAQAGYVVGNSPGVTSTTTERFTPEVKWWIGKGWDAKLSYDLDYHGEYGTRDYDMGAVRYNEIYLRHTGEKYALTLGSQKVIWGRVDGMKPTDQLGSLDLREAFIRDYEDTRRAVPAVRGEYYTGDYKLDGLFVFDLRESEVANRESMWGIVDPHRGRIAGLAENPALNQIISNATFGKDDSGIGGGGIRASKTGGSADYALTVQRARRTIPYYEVNPEITDAVKNGVSLPVAMATSTGDTVTARYPWMWVVGGDVAVPVGSAVLRAEGAWLSDMPVYKSDYSKGSEDAYIFVAGGEFYPGDDELRVILQGMAQIMPGAHDVLDRTDTYSLGGSIEDTFFQGKWVANIDFTIGLDEYDLYINPGITYKGFDAHEIYLEGHYFDGAPQTFGDYYRNNSLITAGWRYQF
ncbi:MAG: hypothetical protein KDI13_00740 [Alphaproteobacteria bacterium]|nr:hypothetical protein [Alphaproteobacteria bacterium]